MSVEASISYIECDGGKYYSILRDITDRKIAATIRDEFAGLIAHDLKNPLSAIMARVQKLKKAANEKDIEILMAIEKSCKRMDKMIQEIARTAKNETMPFSSSGRFPIDLNTLITDIVTEGVPPDNQRRIHFFPEPTERIIMVKGDVSALKRAVTNLILNGLKYSPQNKPVDIHLKKDDREAMIVVRDYGVGISPDDLPHLFERFYRSKTAETQYGLGLGLYITKQIVESHGGKILVTSMPELGSSFSVSLPLHNEVKPELH